MDLKRDLRNKKERMIMDLKVDLKNLVWLVYKLKRIPKAIPNKKVRYLQGYPIKKGINMVMLKTPRKSLQSKGMDLIPMQQPNTQSKLDLRIVLGWKDHLYLDQNPKLN